MSVAAPQPAPRLKAPTWLRENLEAVVVALLLALLIKQFSMEAFVIPTGSMAPTLLGAHVDVECINCGFEQVIAGQAATGSFSDANVGARCSKCRTVTKESVPEDALSIPQMLRRECKNCGTGIQLRPLKQQPANGSKVECVNCRFVFAADLTPQGWPVGSISRGDRILVNKFVYRFWEPSRYEVAVFKFPEEPQENFIKRIVGLPNETIDLKHGQVYINGKVARKPLDVQDAAWVLVNDADYVQQNGGGPSGPSWKPSTGTWKPTDTGDGFLGKAIAGETAWLGFHREITDWNGYNTHPITKGGRNNVGDVRLAFRALLKEPTGALLTQLKHGPDHIDLAIVGGSAKVSRNGELLEEVPVAVDLTAGVEVVFWAADLQVHLELDGEAVLHHFLPEAAPTDPGGVSTVQIGLQRSGGKIEHMKVHRDIYYLRRLPTGTKVKFPKQLGPDEYFALGDNSANSTDSRAWGVVPRGHLVGRAFMVFWPAVPIADWAVRSIK